MSSLEIPGYKILREIGGGGMSRVYLAEDSARRRQVAIKLLPAENLNDLGFRARFEREARLIAALDHEAIVPVYGHGVAQGQPFFVMPFLAHGSLADRLARGPLAPAEAVRILGRIGSALDYAHQQGIVHGDLKASNILFDEGEDAYLADFGIALPAASDWQRHLASGTPAYMSPEQALRKGSVDGRSDIYSMGVIAFEMLAGRLPFSGQDSTAMLLKRLNEPAPAISTANPDLPKALDPVLARALARNPGERWPSAGELAGAVQGALQAAARGAARLNMGEAAAADPGKPDSSAQGPPPDAEAAAAPGAVGGSAGARPRAPREAPEPANPFPFRPQGKSGPGRKYPEGFEFYAVGLAVWLAVLLAAFTAVLARAGVLFPSSNVLLIYRGPALALVNPSYSSVDLSGLVFQRISDQGTVTASFAADQWDQLSPGALKRLAGGDCFQLVRSQGKNLELTAGKAPAKPASCEVSQGWLVAPDRGSLFWISDGEGAIFQVTRDGEVIHGCQIAAGRCDFHLSSPEQENGQAPGS